MTRELFEKADDYMENGTVSPELKKQTLLVYKEVSEKNLLKTCALIYRGLALNFALRISESEKSPLVKALDEIFDKVEKK